MELTGSNRFSFWLTCVLTALQVIAAVFIALSVVGVFQRVVCGMLILIYTFIRNDRAERNLQSVLSLGPGQGENLTRVDNNLIVTMIGSWLCGAIGLYLILGSTIPHYWH